MAFSTLLIANRGEIAIRIARTAAELGIRTVSVFSADDRESLHRTSADAEIEIPGEGPAAYLDAAALLQAAQDCGADSIHPGYGFLAENAEFARQVAASGRCFVGPSPAVLDLFGDKSAARAFAVSLGVPVMRGTQNGISLEDAKGFFADLGGASMMLKASAGGGGRGMRVVRNVEQLESAFKRCQSEARAAFGNGDLYAEQLFESARHLEVQVMGDGVRATHAWERDCSLQRQRQKVIEIAPAPNLAAGLRDRILTAATTIAAGASLDNVATVEFLVDGREDDDAATFAFIECNARIQVEHTVTEEITGLDLVGVQLGLAAGDTLEGLGVSTPPQTRGMAVQLRVNTETMQADGTALPTQGTLTAYEPAAGRGVRIDGYGYTGYATNPRFDSLLAKLIVHVPSAGANGDGLHAVLAKTERALKEFVVQGVGTNLGFLAAALRDEAVRNSQVTTTLVEQRAAAWLADATDASAASLPNAGGNAAGAGLAGAKLEGVDPLAVLDYGKQAGSSASTATPSAPIDVPPGTVVAPMPGTIVVLEVAVGAAVQIGQPLLVMEAMKMEHVISADTAGYVRRIGVGEGDTVHAGHALVLVEAADLEEGVVTGGEALDLEYIRPDLAEVFERRANTLDEGRPAAVARRRKTGQRTTRENVNQLIDPGTFVEYGALTLAARRLRMPMDELIERTPADGLVCGIGQVNNQWFDEDRSRTMVVAYDYTVLAGTQGKKNHQKKDRMFQLAQQWRLPLVLFAEGGGGRPGDTDVLFGANLQVEAFHHFGKLSGLVPLVGITSGRCFAGNAVLLGCCDVIIATANSTIGMGGPAMIEGGGLGVFTPEEVGPMSVQVPNGVVDIAVADEVEAVKVARQYLSYFQGPIPDWDCVDQRKLRHLIPENRLRVYDVREVIDAVADIDSVLELRAGYGHGVVTSFVRIEGRPMGLIANNPMHLGGAIDSDAADKASRFMQLCDAFDIPILSLCDTPGNMVGPDHEGTALVRHCCRMFVVGANITVPVITVVLRKGYGLGAQGMAGGGFHAPLATLSWPTGEFGGMGLEGAIKLGFRDELAAIEDPEERLRAYEEKVAEMYEKGKAISIATYFELDEVIDPAETRYWIVSALKAVPPVPVREGKKRNNIDTW
jgi:acetyl/propionyl-CoA carboxylase alpha subunit/acetyl-CoA carboxylase carboxyltransferase component